MCGIFGMVLPDTYPHHFPRSDALELLGSLSESRGMDAGGIAHFNDAGWHLARTTGPFNRMIDDALLSRLDHAKIAVGHTRWATQGHAGAIANASPMPIGGLLGTHNGDVTVSSIRHRSDTHTDSTDTAALLGAIATAHTNSVDLERIHEVLSHVRGRAALAWVDTAHAPQTVCLARTALSPLVIGNDAHGGVWWASNPAWLRELEHTIGLPFTEVNLVPEGRVLTATPQERRVEVSTRVVFRPFARALDRRLTHAVWRGFSATDRAAGMKLLSHRVALGS